MGRRLTGSDVFSEAVDRMVRVYEQGHRVVVSFSGGKDSGATLEVCLAAAKLTNRLPVEVALQDEEVLPPGTYDYIERVAARPEVQMHWFVARQPLVNVFNRKDPYWWVLDPTLPPEKWMHIPPAWAEEVAEPDMECTVTPKRFPPPPGKELIAALGLRTAESATRLMGLHSSGGYLTKINVFGTRYARPIYDWTDGDVWKAHRDYKWDYNKAYDTLFRLGVPARQLRTGPTVLNRHGAKILKYYAQAWPRWFDKLSERLPGVRQAAMFGSRICAPSRRDGETWKECFERECITEAPAAWLRERAVIARDKYLKLHAHHSTTPFPEVGRCMQCPSGNGSWSRLAMTQRSGCSRRLRLGLRTVSGRAKITTSR